MREITDALVSIEKLKVQGTIAAERMNTFKNVTSNASLLFKNGSANTLKS
ncbi:hypothetical protein [Pedobacter antarcticus]|nr:hypothetical protein [Pedobacter antarcticus]